MGIKSPHNRQLMDAFRTYATATVDYLKAVNPPEVPFALPQIGGFAAAIWVRQQHNLTIWSMSIHRHDEHLHSLPEYSDLGDALQQDSAINPQLDQLVGTQQSAMQVGRDRLIDIVSASIREDRLEFDEERFKSAYIREEDWPTQFH